MSLSVCVCREGAERLGGRGGGQNEGSGRGMVSVGVHALHGPVRSALMTARHV